MPSYTPKQARTMAAAAHNPQFAAKVGIPQGVAQDFNRADTGTSMLHQALTKQHMSKQAMNKQMKRGAPHGRG